MNNRNNWEQMKHIKAPDELKERTLQAARELRRDSRKDARSTLRPRRAAASAWQSGFWPWRARSA